ncbi:hypothetical protein [Butyrivibrio fibrisolvens]|uniref:hypothetical protein n=1 Tax=Butyrivibrio fibrisolvens TaxID=831 RepID=UPI0003FAD42F|nr:hypothetical protein [Butyrivibrio fibrisolvens]
MTVFDLNLSRKTESYLVKARYLDVADLENLTDDELLVVCQDDEKSVKEIKFAIKNERKNAGRTWGKSGVYEFAEKAYKSLEKINVHALNEDWDSEEIIGLVQYDVIKLAGLIYILSDEENRQLIIDRIQELFEIDDSEKIIKNFIESFNKSDIISAFYKKIPYSVGLLYEYDKQEQDSNLSYFILKILELLTISVILPDRKFFVDDRTFLFIGIMETIKNRLISSGIKPDISLLNNLPEFEDLCQLFSYTYDPYVEIEGFYKGEGIFDALVNNFEKIRNIVNGSVNSEINKTYGPRTYHKYAQIIQEMILFNMLKDSIKNYIHYDIEDDEEDKIDTDLLWKQIIDNESKIRIMYGDTCRLIIINEEGYYKKVLYSGSFIQCMKYAEKSTNLLDENDWFGIQTARIDDFGRYSRFTFDRIDTELQDLLGAIQNFPEPFDESILPDSYVHFKDDRVDDSNFTALWDELQKIEKKYCKGIDYENGSIITDWESELCYEQGKYLENVDWVGNNIDCMPEIISKCTYSKLNQEQLRYYLFMRTQIRRGEYAFTYKAEYYCYLYVNELIAELGSLPKEKRLEQLELIYMNYRKRAWCDENWIRQFSEINKLEIKNEELRNWVYTRNCGLTADFKYRNIADLINGNYDKVFDLVYKESQWKPKSSTFIKKTNCLENMKYVVEKIIPKLDIVFSRAGLVLSNFLVGKVREIDWISSLYNYSIWKECVLRRLGIDSDGRRAFVYVYTDFMDYITDEEENKIKKGYSGIGNCKPYLSEYILRYIEMLFRQKVGYDFYTIPDKPDEPLESDDDGDPLSVQSCCRKAEKIYVSLYDDIEKTIIETTKEYFSTHELEMNTLAERFKEAYS